MMTVCTALVYIMYTCGAAVTTYGVRMQFITTYAWSCRLSSNNTGFIVATCSICEHAPTSVVLLT